MSNPTETPSSSKRTLAIVALVLSCLALAYWLLGYFLLIAADSIGKPDPSMSSGLFGILILVTAAIGTPFVVLILGGIGFYCFRSGDPTAKFPAVWTLVLQLVILATAIPAFVAMYIG